MSRGTTDMPATAPRPSGNPNPYRFELVTERRIGDLHVAEVVYPDCTNHEGRKILVMNRDPRTMKAIDPHFTENGYIVARFAPTAQGRRHAEGFAEMLAG